MHFFDGEIDRVADEIFALARHRAELFPVPLDGTADPAELLARTGDTITEQGIGGMAALRLFRDVLAPACLSVDFARYLAFVPCAPTELSVLFDVVVSAYSMYGGSWLEGAGAVHAENQALRWIADLAGLPAESGGVFVSGGTIGNLSALVAARHAAQVERGGDRPARWAVVAARSAHSSVEGACRVMDADLVEAPVGADGRLDGAGVREALRRSDGRAFAVVATAGTTNLGYVDHLADVAAACREHGVWLHVDGAYGGAALAAPSIRHAFAGVEHADSFIVDPHKWLFSPYDSCALLYRDPRKARDAHSHHAPYLEVLQQGDVWNPSDYAVHLTRRARGLPFWFSLAAHGTAAYAAAVETTLEVAWAAAELIRAHPHLELVAEPQLSVIAFRRRGWGDADYVAWCAEQMRTGTSFVVPSAHDGRPMLRFCIVNPRTTLDDIATIVASL